MCRDSKYRVVILHTLCLLFCLTMPKMLPVAPILVTLVVHFIGKVIYSQLDLGL